MRVYGGASCPAAVSVYAPFLLLKRTLPVNSSLEGQTAKATLKIKVAAGLFFASVPLPSDGCPIRRALSRGKTASKCPARVRRSGHNNIEMNPVIRGMVPG